MNAPTLTRVTAASRQLRPESVQSRLVLSSALMLFVELALIRWLGSNVVHLSYFSNFVLLGSFLGIGLGFLLSKRDLPVLQVSTYLLALLVLGVLAFPVTINRSGGNLVYFTSLETEGPPAWLALPVIFLLVAAVLAGPAYVLGGCFAQMAPLAAYRLDLVGSLLGIVSFTVLSFLRAPSVVWGAIAAAALVLLAGEANRMLTTAACLALVAGLFLESRAPGTTWSPYYKVHTETATSADGETVLGIAVNGVPHQVMAPAEWKIRNDGAEYELAYTRTAGNPLDDVLIIGAGSGSDVAIALSKGAGHVDAVDIDPRILQIGEEKNPDRPYQDDRVTTYVDDGRAFLRATDKKYDLILFALPDSLALVNGASQIRLESFLFTQRALETAREHLKPHGSFAMYNFYREDWLIDRLAGTAAAAFGHQPCVDTVDGTRAVVTVAVDEQNQSCGEPYAPSGPVVAPATDDSPFLYFRGESFPAMYLWALGGILLLTLGLVRAVGGPFRAMRPYADLFLMGVAFLLLETKNVATFALLFGTTWIVNAFVFGGVLVVVLAAVEVTRRWRTPPLAVVYAAIAASLLLGFLVPADALLGLAFWPRLVASCALAFLPIFLANVAFAKRFAESADSRSAFAVNLLGAMVGGCLEYAALLTGYRNLLLIVAVVYLGAFLLKPRAVPAPA